ncbi:hypothetical protein AMTRI_Chr07g25690 [Amborella trichopoda]
MAILHPSAIAELCKPMAHQSLRHCCAYYQAISVLSLTKHRRSPLCHSSAPSHHLLSSLVLYSPKLSKPKPVLCLSSPYRSSLCSIVEGNNVTTSYRTRADHLLLTIWCCSFVLRGLEHLYVLDLFRHFMSRQVSDIIVLVVYPLFAKIARSNR